MTVTNTVNIITLLLINTECMVQQKENTNNRQIFPTEEKLLKWKPNIKCRKDINSEKKKSEFQMVFQPTTLRDPARCSYHWATGGFLYHGE